MYACMYICVCVCVRYSWILVALDRRPSTKCTKLLHNKILLKIKITTLSNAVQGCIHKITTQLIIFFK